MLEAAILSQYDQPQEVIRKIYDYIEQEIQRHNSINTLEEMLLNGKGSALMKAKLFHILARRQKIPSRINVGIMMDNKDRFADNKIRFTYFNEVFVQNEWLAINTTLTLFQKIPSQFLLIHRNYDEVENILTDEKLKFEALVERAQVIGHDKKEYRNEIYRHKSWANLFSLYKLPLSFQKLFYGLLLVPFGGLLLAIARNIIGISTFGIFTPILLTLFFKDSGLVFGLFFFAMIVMLGFFERYLLDKFYLLALPRLSIMMSLVILFLICFVLLNHHYGLIPSARVTVFPIVIVTVFIERFSIMVNEEGIINTMKTVMGTFIISLICFFVFSINILQITLFTHPELILIIIGLLFIVGDYKGYRISEALRFKELVSRAKGKG